MVQRAVISAGTTLQRHELSDPPQCLQIAPFQTECYTPSASAVAKALRARPPAISLRVTLLPRRQCSADCARVVQR
jgi:hypothetical protein